jgi:hypothetical protein
VLSDLLLGRIDLREVLHYSLIAQKGRDFDEFTTMCRGAQLAAEGAKAAAAPLQLSGSAGRAALRNVVKSMLLDLFSKP